MSLISHVAFQEVALTGTNYTTVVIVALIALAALVVAALLVREVLAADEGTDSMKKIAKAIQEGASAYLNRQFRTLAVFGVLVFFLLFLLPAAYGAVVRLLLDLIPSGHLFWIIVAVMDSRAARIVTVADFRPKHRLFVGVLATILLRKTALGRAIPGATVDRARTKSSELVLSPQQPTL
jgi:hypothetical protein